MASTAPAKNELIGVQLLRGYAAATVALGHLTGQLSHYSPGLGVGWFPATMGVDIFFTISGFIMIYTSYGRFGSVGSARDFLIRRIIRVVPLYWLFTFLIAIALVVAPNVFHSAKFDIHTLLASLFFVPHESSQGVKPILSLGWTLNFEMFFYAIFTVSLIFQRRVGLAVLFGVIIASAVIGVVDRRLPLPFSYWTWAITLEFLFGVAIGLLFKKIGPRRIPTALWLILFVACVLAGGLLMYMEGAYPHLHLKRVVTWGVPAAGLLILSTVILPAGRQNMLGKIGERIGDSSYALYLSHKFIFGAASLVWAKTIGFGSIPMWIPTLILLIVSLGAGYLVHLGVERPVISLFNKLLPRPSVRSTAALHASAPAGAAVEVAGAGNAVEAR